MMARLASSIAAPSWGWVDSKAGAFSLLLDMGVRRMDDRAGGPLAGRHLTIKESACKPASGRPACARAWAERHGALARGASAQSAIWSAQARACRWAQLICWLARCRVVAAWSKRASSLDSQASARRSNSPRTPSRRSRGGGHGVGHVQQPDSRLHRHAEHHVQHREDAHDEGLVCVFLGQRFLGDQFHQPPADHGRVAHGRGYAADPRRGQQQRGPAEELLQAHQHDRLAERGDFAGQAEAGRIDEPHQVEGQARVLLEDFLDLVGAGLLPHEG